jgi:hypothetical protein
VSNFHQSEECVLTISHRIKPGSEALDNSPQKSSEPNELDAILSLGPGQLEQKTTISSPAKPNPWLADSSPILRPIDMSVSGSDLERRAFGFFVSSSPAVFEVADKGDLGLFTRLTCQMVNHVPSIKSALTCLVLYFMSLADPESSQLSRQQAEYQYMKIIKHAVDPKTAPKHLTEITVLCLLLVCIEGHRNDHERAFTHLRGAMSIVRDSQSKLGAIDDSVKRLYERMQRRLIMNTIDLGRPRTDIILSDGDLSYRDLYTTTRWICDHHLFNFASMSAKEKSVAQQCALKLLDENAVAMCANASDDFHCYYLLIQLSIVKLVVQNIHRPRYSMFALPVKSWEHIFEHNKRFIHANDRGILKLGSQQVSPIRFGFASERNLDLFFVACEAVDLSIRLRAITCLRQFCRREKFWDSYHTARIAEWLFEKENQRRIVQGSLRFPKSNHFLMTNLTLYVENLDDISSTFRRPSWARVQVESEDSVGFHWICLEDPRFGPVSISKSPQLSRLRLCYECDEPLWPSMAKMIGQAQIGDRISVPF